MSSELIDSVDDELQGLTVLSPVSWMRNRESHRKSQKITENARVFLFFRQNACFFGDESQASGCLIAK